MLRVCKECGQTFETKSSRAMWCDAEHHRFCPICGEDFIVPRDKLREPRAFCSVACVNKAKGQANLTRSKQYTRICELCGKEFQSCLPNSRICYDHNTAVCAWCGKEFSVNRTQLLAGIQSCSPACASALSHAHTDQAVATANFKAAMMRKYGVDSATKIPSVAAKAVATRRSRYGEHLEDIVAKQKSTNLARYGTEYLMQNKAFQDKSRQTCLAKYGVDNYAKSQKFLEDIAVAPQLVANYYEFKSGPHEFIAKRFPNKQPTLAELSRVCGVRDSSIGYVVDQLGCRDLIGYAYSNMEDELYEFLKQLDPNLQIERNTFKYITPYELDLYLPDYRLAIECNPTVTHNSTCPGFSTDDSAKPRNYHKMKSDMCEAQDIFLFHIFGYEWTYRKDIIKSMLASLLSKSPNRIYARNTEIQKISDQECMDFLNSNHRQGGAHSKVRLGLFCDSELVSVMTFSKIRQTIGSGKTDLSDCWELVRFCSKLNTTVVGGASKLFTYFVQQYTPTEIRSFSDRAHTRGQLYHTLGFTYQHTTDPGYMWVSLKTDRAYARNNAQKKNIVEFLKDPTIDLTKTETEIMCEHGFVQVFDSGVKLWSWKKMEVV